MELLHKDRKEFDTILSLTNKTTGIDPEIIEKDYYVTKILQGLNERLDYIVFKGGTSLSKCYKVINRFSEDIDITIDMDLTWGQMRKIYKKEARLSFLVFCNFVKTMTEFGFIGCLHWVLIGIFLN